MKANPTLNDQIEKSLIKVSPSAGIGILGGSFDPIHLGHTQSAENVANELSLQKVLLIPAYVSPHKASPALAPQANTKQRARMIELACEKHALLTCDQRELLRSGPSFTVETLKELRHEYPNNPLYFIIGMDSLMTFTQWHQYQEILSLCHLVVNTRPNYPLSELNSKTREILDIHQVNDVATLRQHHVGKIFFAHQHFFNISSSSIRHKLAQKKPCYDQLSPAVADFINKNSLYR